MGVDRKLFISNRWDVEDVKETLENLFDTKVKYEPTHSPDYVLLNFTAENQQRSMSVFTNSEVAGFKGLSLSLGYSGNSDSILTKLAERFGGFYQPSDVTNDYQSYDYVAGGNLEFLLKDAIKTGATDGCNVKDFIDYLVESEKESKKAEEKRQKDFEKLLRGRK